MWILIIEIPLTVSEIPLTESRISLTYHPKETRVAYAVQYQDLFFKVKFHLR
jgi:hypothetical protein